MSSSRLIKRKLSKKLLPSSLKSGHEFSSCEVYQLSCDISFLSAIYNCELIQIRSQCCEILRSRSAKCFLCCIFGNKYFLHVVITCGIIFKQEIIGIILYSFFIFCQVCKNCEASDVSREGYFFDNGCFLYRLIIVWKSREF